MNEIKKLPTYKRQRFLLSFIRQLSGAVKSTDLQKLVFLHTMREYSDYYEFVPYKYGSYSFQLREDLDILQRDGFVMIERLGDSTQIRAAGEYDVENSLLIFRERGDELIRRAYREYPYYAIKSEITSRIFQGEELIRFNYEKDQYTKNEQVLFNIGYEGTSIEAFVNILIKNDVRLLCDVRMNPLSRKFGFSKGKLDHILHTVGIKYVHIPGLGIESDKRTSLDTLEDYKCLFDDYEKSLSDKQVYLNSVFSLLQRYSRIALMCFEHEPEKCHRHVVRDQIVKTHQVRSVSL